MPTVAAAAQRADQARAAEQELRKLRLWGQRSGADPIESFREEHARTAGRVDALEQRLVELEGDDDANARVIAGLSAALDQERDRLLRVSESAVRIKLDLRVTAQNEETGAEFAAVLHGVLNDLQLTEAQRQASGAIARWRLMQVGGVDPGPKPPAPSEIQSAMPALPAGAGDPLETLRLLENLDERQLRKLRQAVQIRLDEVAPRPTTLPGDPPVVTPTTVRIAPARWSGDGEGPETAVPSPQLQPNAETSYADGERRFLLGGLGRLTGNGRRR